MMQLREFGTARIAMWRAAGSGASGPHAALCRRPGAAAGRRRKRPETPDAYWSHAGMTDRGLPWERGPPARPLLPWSLRRRTRDGRDGRGPEGAADSAHGRRSGLPDAGDERRIGLHYQIIFLYMNVDAILRRRGRPVEWSERAEIGRFAAISKASLASNWPGLAPFAPNRPLFPARSPATGRRRAAEARPRRAALRRRRPASPPVSAASSWRGRKCR